MKVEGKVALVTGGAMGLGKGFCNMLLENGAKVCFTDINEETAKTTLNEFQKEFGDSKVIFVKANVTSDSEMQDAFKQAKSWGGSLDIVINNAGVTNEQQWVETININLTSVVRCTLLAMDYMRQDKGGEGGVIIQVASAAGLVPVSFSQVYCATKAGVIMYTRSVAADSQIEANGVRINALCPGFVNTSLVAGLQTPEGLKFIQENGGMMQVEHVAGAMYELITDDSRHGAVLMMTELKGKNYITFPE